LEESSGTTSAVLSTATFDHVLIDSAPTVIIPASITPNPGIGTTGNLTVLGGDTAGESGLIYTWATASAPSGAPSPTFGANGTNAAKTVGVTFHEAGNYPFMVRITTPGGLSVSSAVSLSVNQTVTSINLSPGTAALNSTATAQFLAVASDQFGQP